MPTETSRGSYKDFRVLKTYIKKVRLNCDNVRVGR